MSCPSGKVFNESLVLLQVLLNGGVNLILSAATKTDLRRITGGRSPDSVLSPDWVIPHDVPGQWALLHGVWQVGGDLVDGRNETVPSPQPREGNSPMNTKHLGMGGRK